MKLGVISVVLAASIVSNFSEASESKADEQIRACFDCHGENGVSTEKDIPTIAGLSGFYLDEQMRAYRSEERPCEESKYRHGDVNRPATTMCKVGKLFSDADIEKIAAYFEKQRFVPAKQSFDPVKVAAGKKIHVRSCKKCHSDGGSLAFDDASILSGQWAPYLKKTFQQFRSGDRWMAEKMKPKIEELNDSDVEMLINYYASNPNSD